MLDSNSVEVIVTCYNQERFIRQALDSIAAQTVPVRHTVVIDGYSQDRSVSVIQKWITEHPDFPVTFIAHDKNYGLCATLNQGMELVKSDFVLTLYGDDWLMPDRVEIQAPLLAQSSDDTCLLVGGMREVDKRGNFVVDHDYRQKIEPLLAMSTRDRLASLISENVIPSPAVMLKSNYVRNIGGYDESLTFDDYDLWLRLLSQHAFLYDPRPVVNYRVLANSLSRSPARHGDFLLSEARMISKYADVDVDINQRIARRLWPTARKLVEYGDTARLTQVLRLLEKVTTDGMASKMLWRLRFPGGIRSLQRKGLMSE